MRHPTDTARLDLLRSLPGLAGLGRAESRALLRHFDEADVEAGTVLARSGRPCAELLIVLGGEVRVTGTAGTRTLARGDSWGWREIAARELNPATVVAATPARLLVMGRAQFRALAALAAPTPAPAAPASPAISRAS